MAKRLHKIKTYRGFTLLEVLIYTIALSVLVGVVTGIIILIYRYKTVIEDRVSVNNDLNTLVKTIQDDMYLGTGESVSGNRLTVTFPASGGIVVYYLQGNQIYRQLNSGAALAVTATGTDVETFNVTDISSTNGSGTVQIDLDMSNYPTGTLKPLIRETISFTISLKFVS